MIRGYDTLESKMAPGAERVVNTKIEDWLKQAILSSTTVEFGYDTNLWTSPILVDLVKQEFDVTVSESTVRLHLKALELSCQKPEYQDVKRDDQEIEYFFNDKFQRIQRLVEKIEADIGFEDESGIRVMTRSGRTWGLKGQTPIIKVSMERGGYNVLSVVTAQGDMDYSIKEGTINGERYIEFLEELISKRNKPLILLVDHATFHGSKRVREFVRAHRSQLRVFFCQSELQSLIQTNNCGMK